MENTKIPIGYCGFSQFPRDWQLFFKQGQADRLGELIAPASGNLNTFGGIVSLLYGFINPLLGVWVVIILSQKTLADILSGVVNGISGDDWAQTLILTFMALLFISLGFYYFMLAIFNFIEAILHRMGIYRFGLVLAANALLIRFPGDDWKGEHALCLPRENFIKAEYKPARLKSETPGKIQLHYINQHALKSMIEFDNFTFVLSGRELTDKINNWQEHPGSSQNYKLDVIVENRLKQFWLTKISSLSAYVLYALILLIVFNYTPVFSS